MEAVRSRARCSHPVRALLCCLALVGALCGWSAAVLADEPVAKSRLGGVAIGGHDAAAYHSLALEPRADAVPGSKAHSVDYKGATWRFADAASADAFRADPERYAPAYNGHCANALSLGEGLIRTDGTHWQIFDGDDTLYLFYAARGRERWSNGDRDAYKRAADAAWAALTR